MKVNIKANKVCAEVHVEDLGDRDCETKIRNENADNDLGLHNSKENTNDDKA